MANKNNHNHRFKKRFGQNFLEDANYIYKIIDACDLQSTDDILEVGPGNGALTNHIVSAVKSLTLIEIDNDLAKSLQSKYQDNDNVNVIHADVMKTDFNDVASGKILKVIGNLPYNISTPLLFQLFKNSHLFSDMFFMLQKEVAERLASTHGNKSYGRLTIMASCYCDIEVLFIVPNTAFYPSPKVESAIVHLRPNSIARDNDVDMQVLNNIVTKAFSARRKTISNGLKGLLDQNDFLELDISSKLRPEQIPKHDYIKIAKLVKSKSLL
ncbi:MAG: 16S rRNA (adenine(1518)-N(6)/adenine(1519)-N(6))-dimethyltransferase RsmA [Francisellaceae bacterium]|jgi:16S rRNA (adenine1518-N6/adenine1519-N6)-dimethyltransferase|nr:16S rRNA (adenine(1518)-N(6)/adenine(1519)-N(6))-dimethyltransferase RsmA [Francisellaceae bacterium]MBT6538229.1 16S rRNA (adenine(1518)-N(6)/adenine(1519)-N(6))-dimethyltransferase RsmA [Francisellaceae bacterium]